MNLISKPIPDEHKKVGNHFFVISKYPEGESPDRYEACATEQEVEAHLKGEYANDDTVWIEEYQYVLQSRLVAVQQASDWLKHRDE